MHAIQVTEFGGPDVLSLEDAPQPEPGPGEVLVELARAGVNFIDCYMRRGDYAKLDTYTTPLPMTIGMEGAGTVAALGADVEDFAVGDRVAYCIHRGSYAEFATVPARRLVPVPDDVNFDIATALQLQGSTAHYLTHSAFPLGPDNVCLIHAGAGGVGQLAIQLAKARGAQVITTVGSEEKAGIARERGADHCIVYTQEDFVPQVTEITEGRGVDVVYEGVGRATFERSLECLHRRGTCILFGGASGHVDSVDPLDLAEAGSVFLTRPHLADYIATPKETRGRAADLFEAVAKGNLTVTIDRTLPLAEARQAHEIIEGRGTKGKLLLEISG